MTEYTPIGSITGPRAIAAAGTTRRKRKRINASRGSAKNRKFLGTKFRIFCPGCGVGVMFNPNSMVFSHTCGEKYRLTKGHK